jgi:triacylglycerol lipase
MTSKKFLAVGISLLGLAAGAAHAQTNPFAKGPNPTAAALQANGPFAVTTQTLGARGFGGGTIMVPTAAGQYGAACVCPGFLARRDSITAISRRLATHGFVTVAMDTNSTFDADTSRGTQLQACLNALTALNTGAVAGKVDRTRLFVGGWSMGGGGVLFASRSNAALKAGLEYAPFTNNTKTFNTAVPQLIVGGSADNIAPIGNHSTLFFNNLPNATPKVFGVIPGADHFFPTQNTPIAVFSRLNIAWAKRFVDNDTRYTQFINAAALQGEVNAGRLNRGSVESIPAN